jgi:chromatin remodeling complex protein RSC6
VTDTDWTLAIMGRILDEKPREETRFLNYFKSVNIQFEKEDQRYYKNVDWENQGEANFDAINIKRSWQGERDDIHLSLLFDKKDSPEEFILSSELSEILDFERGTYLKIVNALWLYIKLNRLQDGDNKQICNQAL